jgi:hypothetical protein
MARTWLGRRRSGRTRRTWLSYLDGSMTSSPRMYGRSTSGTTTDPSLRW